MNFVKGDLFDLAERDVFDVVVHGCNCFNTMGSGIAKTVKEQYPEAYAADCKTQRGDASKLGTFTSAIVGNDSKFILVNAYTQYRYNNTKEVLDLFEYESFAKILDLLAIKYSNSRFGFPMIGMERAGGSKEKILGMISDFSNKVSKTGGTVTIVEYNGKKNA